MSAVAVQTRPWHSAREAARATLYVAGRQIRNTLRSPVAFIPAMLIPLFFYFVQAASLKSFAEGAGIGNYEGFVLPVALLFSMSNENAGVDMVIDIERGYFDKLLLTPASRIALLIGMMGANVARILFQGVVVTAVALVSGLDFATGLAGVAPMILLGGAWGMAFAAIGMGVALKTGNAQATQGSVVVVFPLLFLTTSFAPQEALSGWLRTAVKFNPVTYLLEGMRSFSVNGFDAGDIGRALLAVGAVAVLTLGFAFTALRGRAR